jgi:hypothetical protein
MDEMAIHHKYFLSQVLQIPVAEVAAGAVAKLHAVAQLQVQQVDQV